MTKTKKRTQLIKLVFGLALFLFIGWKVGNAVADDQFNSLSIADNWVTLLVMVILLMIVNWLLESLKWHLLVKGIKPQKFIKTFADVLAGVSTSLLTPNRIGNFIGRTVDFEKETRTKAIIATIHSNIAQFLASIIFGTVGLMLVGLENELVDDTAIRISAYLVIVVGAFLYLYPKVLDVNPLSRLYSSQLKDGLEYIQAESLGLKAGILVLSLMRYLVFLTQFYLFLLFFEAIGEAKVLIPAISIVYLIATVIPSFLFGKLFVREASALFVLEAAGVQTEVIVATVFFLWILNLALPSIAGAIILMKK